MGSGYWEDAWLFLNHDRCAEIKSDKLKENVLLRIKGWPRVFFESLLIIISNSPNLGYEVESLKVTSIFRTGIQPLNSKERLTKVENHPYSKCSSYLFLW